MKIIRYNNPDPTTTTTTLSTAIEYNDTELVVADASSLSVDDFILLEDIGHEKCEIVQITVIDSNTLTTTAVTLPHDASITITKLNYDKATIEKSTNGTTYTDLVEQDLNYADVNNCIQYFDDDVDASDSLYYKIYYYNSSTTTEDLQATLHNEENYGYINVDKFRAETGFTTAEVSNAEVERAIYTSLEWIQDNAYVYHEFDGPQDSVYSILTNMEFADWNGDGVIDKNDIIIYEYDQENLMRRYLSNKIIKVNPDTKKIFFSEQVPISSSNNLVIKIPVTFKQYKDIRGTLQQISKLIATNYILMNVDTSKIKNGVTSWTAGGTSVNRDLSNLKDSIDKNVKNALRLLAQIEKMYTRSTKLRTTYSSLNTRGRYNIGYADVSRRFY